MTRIISIEGNIGAGKSTIIEHIRQRIGDDVIVVNEPIREWLNCKDNSGCSKFESFNKCPDLRAFEFQLYVQMTRIVEMSRILKNIKDDKLIIVERTIESGNKIFGGELVERGLLSPAEQRELVRITSCLKSWEDEYIILIKTEPSICLDRIRNRARGGEESVDLKFLERLDRLYNGFGTIEVDGSQSPEMIAELIIEHIRK